MSHFFIERPVFAWVIAIVIMLTGLLAVRSLPIEQYPKIAPPTVSIRANYPGASAATVENAVTQVIEQKLTGIDNLRYFSASSSDGSMSITLTFEPGTDPDIAQVQTQNKVSSAVSTLPQEVQQQGVSVTKSNDSFLLVVGFYSKDGAMSNQKISDLLVSKFQDPISRINGVGSVRVFGGQNAMRVWLDPSKLYSYNLTPIDVYSAIDVQNTDIAAGQLGGMPAIEGQQVNATIKAQSRLETVQDFENIVLRVNTDGSQLRVKDVAKVEIGTEDYDRIARYKRQPAAGMAISLATGANALDTADAVKARVEELVKFLPEGVEYMYPIDATPFIEKSITSVEHTLIEAIVLVFLVMLLFLQNLRATLIPTIAVPVVLLGTFAILLAFGYSINVLTMFAMVLAIGLLVDDAIVVVENVERIMKDEGLSPKEATKKSMKQITGALIGIAVVLSTVFIPMAFFSGSAGAIYRQFSITIVSAMGLSVLVALVLSPCLCATLLKPHRHDDDAKKLENLAFLSWFNRQFNKLRDFYERTTTYMARRIMRFTGIYVLLVGGMIWIFSGLPTSFLPNEDQGYMYLMANTPAGSTAERTLESMKKVEDYFLDQQGENVEHLFTVVGFSFAGSAQNAGFGFVGLKDWDERKRPDQSVTAIQGAAFGGLSQIKDATVYPIAPPPIRELGNSSGFEFQLVDRAAHGHEALMAARNQFLGMAAQDPRMTAVRPNGLDDVPQYKINIDSEKASALGLSLSDINRTLQIAWGSSYVNDFLDDGRIKKVYLQSEASARMMPEDLKKWYVRNSSGDMVPFSAFSTSEWTFGSPKLERFSGTSSVNIQGGAAPGVSTGEAMEAAQEIVNKLPAGYGIEWTGISFEERAASSTSLMLYSISILVVFLCLAALYESWAVPFAVLLTLPLGILGTVVSASLMNFLANYFGWAGFSLHLSNDVYFQVALLTTVGLTAKNAILIIEFAKELRDSGHEMMESISMAARLRFRPIIMTSMAFILGVTPLALSSGAGAAAQNAIGISVMGGMIAATFIAIFFVPMFYVMIEKIFRKKNRGA
ncbi:MAG: efflux RND transporter permease subunit [Pseudobdellovibrionaceae bacterium]|jgi:multidrug efflux pump|nr:efflux RND transporter permease subunit [Pseudobdellovibrionaceae bacterium]